MSSTYGFLCHTTIEMSLVERIEQDSRQSVVQLQAEDLIYETKLNLMMQLALRDALAGVASRRKSEDRIERRIAHQHVLCVVILDLEGFKHVSNTYRLHAGDSLPQQYLPLSCGPMIVHGCC